MEFFIKHSEVSARVCQSEKKDYGRKKELEGRDRHQFDTLETWSSHPWHRKNPLSFFSLAFTMLPPFYFISTSHLTVLLDLSVFVLHYFFFPNGKTCACSGLPSGAKPPLMLEGCMRLQYGVTSTVQWHNALIINQRGSLALWLSCHHFHQLLCVCSCAIFSSSLQGSY